MFNAPGTFCGEARRTRMALIESSQRPPAPEENIQLGFFPFELSSSKVVSPSYPRKSTAYERLFQSCAPRFFKVVSLGREMTPLCRQARNQEGIEFRSQVGGLDASEEPGSRPGSRRLVVSLVSRS